MTKTTARNPEPRPKPEMYSWENLNSLKKLLESIGPDNPAYGNLSGAVKHIEDRLEEENANEQTALRKEGKAVDPLQNLDYELDKAGVGPGIKEPVEFTDESDEGVMKFKPDEVNLSKEAPASQPTSQPTSMVEDYPASKVAGDKTIRDDPKLGSTSDSTATEGEKEAFSKGLSELGGEIKSAVAPIMTSGMKKLEGFYNSLTGDTPKIQMVKEATKAAMEKKKANHAAAEQELMEGDTAQASQPAAPLSKTPAEPQLDATTYLPQSKVQRKVTVTGSKVTPAREAADEAKHTEIGGILKDSKTLADKSKALQEHIRKLKEDKDPSGYAEEISRIEQAVDNIQYLEVRKIDPERWWKRKPMLGKVLMGLGATLAAWASGHDGRRNQVMDLIDRAIDRDVNAQIKDIENQAASNRLTEAKKTALLKQAQELRTNGKKDALAMAKLELDSLSLSLRTLNTRKAAEALAQMIQKQADSLYTPTKITTTETFSEGKGGKGGTGFKKGKPAKPNIGDLGQKIPVKEADTFRNSVGLMREWAHLRASYKKLMEESSPSLWKTGAVFTSPAWRAYEADRGRLFAIYGRMISGGQIAQSEFDRLDKNVPSGDWKFEDARAAGIKFNGLSNEVLDKVLSLVSQRPDLARQFQSREDPSGISTMRDTLLKYFSNGSKRINKTLNRVQENNYDEDGFPLSAQQKLDRQKTDVKAKKTKDAEDAKKIEEARKRDEEWEKGEAKRAEKQEFTYDSDPGIPSPKPTTKDKPKKAYRDL